MKVAQPLVEQNSRRAAADRRSLRCAADLWLNPEAVKERDNIRVSLSIEPPAGLVRGSLCDEVPLDDGKGRSGSLSGICADRASFFIMLAAWMHSVYRTEVYSREAKGAIEAARIRQHGASRRAPTLGTGSVSGDGGSPTRPR
jgi:hypothetical protein